MKKFPASMQHIVMPFFLSLMMSGIVSAVATIRALGFEAMVTVWPLSWLTSWIVAFPAVLLVLPVARRLTALVVERQ